MALDKKKQILAALNIRDIDGAEATNIYNKVVTADKIIDRNGEVVEKGEQGGTKAGFLCNSASMKEGKLALYVCNVEGETKYVIPVYGMGLWGGINGYIALNADKQSLRRLLQPRRRDSRSWRRNQGLARLAEPVQGQARLR